MEDLIQRVTEGEMFMYTDPEGQTIPIGVQSPTHRRRPYAMTAHPLAGRRALDARTPAYARLPMPTRRNPSARPSSAILRPVPLGRVSLAILELERLAASSRTPGRMLPTRAPSRPTRSPYPGQCPYHVSVSSR